MNDIQALGEAFSLMIMRLRNEPMTYTGELFESLTSIVAQHGVDMRIGVDGDGKPTALLLVKGYLSYRRDF